MQLATTYMGLELRNPLVASASPLSHTVDGVRRLADAGVGAIVLPRCSRSNFAMTPYSTTGCPTPAPRVLPNRCPTSPPRSKRSQAHGSI